MFSLANSFIDCNCFAGWLAVHTHLKQTVSRKSDCAMMVTRMILTAVAAAAMMMMIESNVF